MNRTRAWIFIFALTSITTLLGSDSSFAKHTATNEWRVRHKLTNLRSEPGTPLLLRLENGFIRAFDGKNQVLNVPVSQVLAISADDDAHRPIHEWLMSTVKVGSSDAFRQALASPVDHDLYGIKQVSGMICAGFGTAFCHYKDTDFLATIASDIVIAGFVSLIDSHHPYRCLDLIWMEDGVLRNALFHVDDKKQERPLLDALAAATGKAWVDLAERRHQLGKEIESYNVKAQSLVLDRAVLVEGEHLGAGEYRVVVIARDQGVELNFFRGNKVSPERLVAQATAQVMPRDEAGTVSTAATIHYLQGESADRITEITTRDSDYVLNAAASATIPSVPTAPSAEPAPTSNPKLSVAAPAAPVAASVVAGKRDVMALHMKVKDGRGADVTLVTYRGQRAFRFPVEHLHRTHMGTQIEECAGSLYIMADRVAFDAGLNLHKDRDPFDIARTELKEFKIVPRSMTSWGAMRLVTGKKTYDFMPYFSNTRSPLASLPEPGSGPAGAISMAVGGVQMWHVGTAGRPMLDAFMDALHDFAETIAEVESGTYIPKPHKGNEAGQKGADERASKENTTPR